jgi:hypothetical protein
MHSAKVSAKHPQQAPLPRERLRPSLRFFDAGLSAIFQLGATLARVGKQPKADMAV